MKIRQAIDVCLSVVLYLIYMIITGLASKSVYEGHFLVFIGMVLVGGIILVYLTVNAFTRDYK